MARAPQRGKPLLHIRWCLLYRHIDTPDIEKQRVWRNVSSVLVHVLISFTFNRIGLLYHASFLHAHDCPPCRITPSLLCAILLQPIQHLHRPPTEPPHRAAHRTLPETARRFHMHLQPIQHLHRPPTQPPHRAGYRALPETARRFHMHLQHKRASTVTCQLLLKRRSGPRGTINRAIRHNAR